MRLENNEGAHEQMDGTQGQVPSVGRIVHYVLEDGPHKGEHRPAIIVKVWAEPGQEQPGTACQLQVFTDGNGQPEYNDGLPPVLWKTSRQQGDWPGSWHWPEMVPAAAPGVTV
jgi:hypothetical protein